MGSKIALRKWDVLDHLKTEEDIELYFDACVEEDPGDGSLSAPPLVISLALVA